MNDDQVRTAVSDLIAEEQKRIQAAVPGYMELVKSAPKDRRADWNAADIQYDFYAYYIDTIGDPTDRLRKAAYAAMEARERDALRKKASEQTQ